MSTFVVNKRNTLFNGVFHFLFVAIVRPPDRYIGRLYKFYLWTFFLSFSINTPRSAAGHWMAIKYYSGDSVVGKASTIDPEISATLP